MATTLLFDTAWGAYQEAVRDLYAASGTVDRGGGTISAEGLDARGAIAETQSAAVRDTLTAALESEDLGRRELATLKLLATAMYDLSVANDILELGKPRAGRGADRSARNLVLTATDLRQVLDAPLETGIVGVLEIDRGALSPERAAAQDQLEKSVAKALKGIPEGAASLGQMAIGGMAGLGLGPLQGATSVAAQEILAHVPEGASAIIRRAAGLVTEAVRKLQVTAGPQQEQQVREQVSSWIKDVTENRDTVTGLLDTLYETSRVAQEIDTQIKAASAAIEVEQLNQAIRSLETLLASQKKTQQVLDWVMRILAFAKKPLLAAVPWGSIGVYASYSAILGYAIYDGGDRLDWYRLGDHARLDRVQGVRSTIRHAFPQPPADQAASGH